MKTACTRNSPESCDRGTGHATAASPISTTPPGRSLSTPMEATGCGSEKKGASRGSTCASRRDDVSVKNRITRPELPAAATPGGSVTRYVSAAAPAAMPSAIVAESRGAVAALADARRRREMSMSEGMRRRSPDFT
ncbi:MAG: hypothetical protein U0575_00880 [Phycisphaerales bacterium]